LVWHQTRFNKEHDLRYLGNLAIQRDSTLQGAIDEAAELNPFAVTFRYPGELDAPTAEDASNALDTAQRLYDEILRRLPEEVRPRLTS
jgi:hypothetical protein